MLKSISTAEMKRLDRLAAEKFGILTLILMENAGRGIADLAERILNFDRHCERPKGAKQSRSRLLCRANRSVPDDEAAVRRLTDWRRFAPRNDQILIVCGKGNNGGDGFVTARHLFNRNFKIQVVLLAHPKELKGDSAVNYKILKNMRVSIHVIDSIRKINVFSKLIKTSDLIIDAIFGIGLSREVTGLIQACIKVLNQSKKKILSIDIPSGINSDTGKVMNEAVKADMTGTLHAPKIGLTLKPGSDHAGKVEILDISIPAVIAKQHSK